MVSKIETAWALTMSGTSLDVELFVQDLLRVAEAGMQVAGHARSEREIEIRVGADALKLASDGCVGKLRMVCARLATVFGALGQAPPMAYEGSISKRIPLGEGTLSAHLEFSNEPGDVWFRLSRSS